MKVMDDQSLFLLILKFIYIWKMCEEEVSVSNGEREETRLFGLDTSLELIY